MLNPFATWPGRAGSQGPSHHIVGQHLIVLLADDGRTIITVKLRTRMPYVDWTHTRWEPAGGTAGCMSQSELHQTQTVSNES